MALDEIQKKYIPQKSSFYANHYHHVIIALMGLFLCIVIIVGVLFYQILHRPLPQFNAMQTDGKKMLLVPYDEPNLLPATILRWASKAATMAYTFDFVNYAKQAAAAKAFFTEDGWQDYQASVNDLISTIVENQLFVNGVVSGTPVISNQGPIPGRGYVWRVQIPFLVTYQSANIVTTRNFIVVLSIVRVPTKDNKQGIGIDQFVMQ
jgi:intracellular multiplication protein IcmL